MFATSMRTIALRVASAMRWACWVTLPGSLSWGHVVVEIGTRKLTDEDRERDLRASLEFARTHLGHPVD